MFFFLDCNVTIRGYQGAIEMAQQENMRTDMCEWKIVAPKGSKVNMTFTSFKIPQKRPIRIMEAAFERMSNYSRRVQLTVSTILYLQNTNIFDDN